MKSKAVRKAIDTVRAKAGLAVYAKELTPPVKCDTCGRAYQWRAELLPADCPWHSCDGKVKQVEAR